MLIRLFLLSVALVLTGCSAIELYQQNAGATRLAATAIDARVAGVIATADAEQDALAATVGALRADATAAAQSIAAIQASAEAALATATPDPLSSEQLSDAAFSAADIVVFGRVPVDSERLNTIAALAFDGDGQLLVATRAGEIYRLIDGDDDGAAEQNQLIFQDVNDEIGQVSGMLLQGDSLLLINDGQLNSLADSDADGSFDRVTLLSSDLPQNQNPLHANNAMARSADGRLFTADVNTGEILRILPRE